MEFFPRNLKYLADVMDFFYVDSSGTNDTNRYGTTSIHEKVVMNIFVSKGTSLKKIITSNIYVFLTTQLEDPFQEY